MRYGYTEKDEVEDEEVTFTITCTMRKRWAPQLVSMLKQMEYLGNIGSSRRVTILADGDGDFRPRFEADTDFQKVEPAREHNGDTYYDAG